MKLDRNIFKPMPELGYRPSHENAADRSPVSSTSAFLSTEKTMHSVQQEDFATAQQVLELHAIGHDASNTAEYSLDTIELPSFMSKLGRCALGMFSHNTVSWTLWPTQRQVRTSEIIRKVRFLSLVATITQFVNNALRQQMLLYQPTL